MQNMMTSFFQMFKSNKPEGTEKPNMYRNRVLAQLDAVTPVDDTLSRLRVLQQSSKSRLRSPQKRWHNASVGSQWAGR